MRTLSFCLFVVVSMLGSMLVPACSSEDGAGPNTGNTPSTGPTEDDFLTAAGLAICESAAPCCQQAGRPINTGCDDYKKEYFHKASERGKTLGGTYNPGLAQKCLEGIAMLKNVCDTSVESFGDACDLDAVFGIPVGAVPFGGECDGEQNRCADPNGRCVMNGNTGKGTCGVYSVAGAGQACGSPMPGKTIACAAGFFCPSGLPQTCRAVPKIGDGCEFQCVEGARCSQGVCIEATKIGEPCTTLDECASQNCENMVCGASKQTSFLVDNELCQ